MTWSQRVDAVARKLVRLVDEHGAPNSFGCVEVARCGIAAAQAGLVARRHALELDRALRANLASFSVEYRGRRFHVTPKKD